MSFSGWKNSIGWVKLMHGVGQVGGHLMPFTEAGLPCSRRKQCWVIDYIGALCGVKLGSLSF